MHRRRPCIACALPSLDAHASDEASGVARILLAALRMRAGSISRHEMTAFSRRTAIYRRHCELVYVAIRIRHWSISFVTRAHRIGGASFMG